MNNRRNNRMNNRLYRFHSLVYLHPAISLSVYRSVSLHTQHNAKSPGCITDPLYRDCLLKSHFGRFLETISRLTVSKDVRDFLNGDYILKTDQRTQPFSALRQS